jgi:biopolymer transport protein ExbD
MKKHSMPEMKEGGVNVTPLIDVIMCLIIFFILVAKIGVSNGLDKTIDMPTTYMGINLTDMGNALALNLYKTSGSIEPQILAELKGNRQTELKFQDKKADGSVIHPLVDILKLKKTELGENFKVIINADKGMTYAQIQLVLQACAEAGVSKVNFATQKSKGKVVAG